MTYMTTPNDSVSHHLHSKSARTLLVRAGERRDTKLAEDTKITEKCTLNPRGHPTCDGQVDEIDATALNTHAGVVQGGGQEANRALVSITPPQT